MASVLWSKSTTDSNTMHWKEHTKEFGKENALWAKQRLSSDWGSKITALYHWIAKWAEGKQWVWKQVQILTTPNGALCKRYCVSLESRFNRFTQIQRTENLSIIGNQDTDFGGLSNPIMLIKWEDPLSVLLTPYIQSREFFLLIVTSPCHYF